MEIANNEKYRCKTFTAPDGILVKKRRDENIYKKASISYFIR